jgi:prepilin-type N-terminal cleavage/methylation domain-containing protein
MIGKRHGFSLIELMLVTALMTLMAGVSVPLIVAGMKRYTVISGSQQVAGEIRSVRMQAVARNKTLKVHFESGGGTFQVLDTADNPVAAPMSLPPGARFADVSSDIEFDSSGRLGDPAIAPITIVVGNGHQPGNRTITVSANGRVQLR